MKLFDQALRINNWSTKLVFKLISYKACISDILIPAIDAVSILE